MLLCRAPETQGSFQVSASVERVKLGVLVEFHSVSQQTPKQGDVYLPVMLGQGEAVMRHRGSPGTAEVRKTLSNDGKFGTGAQSL